MLGNGNLTEEGRKKEKQKEHLLRGIDLSQIFFLRVYEYCTYDMSLGRLTLLGKSLRGLTSTTNPDENNNNKKKEITESAFSKLVSFTEITVYFSPFLFEQQLAECLIKAVLTSSIILQSKQSSAGKLPTL